ncbi:acyl-CoA dehydratase activase [uncultured Faecalibaculum sp.]|uniref:acyl-CoA dehydratase activase n=3 Tax=uncultured Faecalibaculum sp. TaxID=1729681 RepID=UPI0025F35C12|nr:acyl-CoA dehydratase activase [uncultured Faecalibaculum sp.]
MHRIGLDIGSTTIKTVVLNESGRVCHTQYERHYSRIAQKTREVLQTLSRKFPGLQSLCISGSAGIGLSEQLGIRFAQEVFATRQAVTTLQPEADVVIELGGEDAKILFLSGGTDFCMNGSCAGGTGAFIDQMATLLQISQDEMNALAMDHEKIYPVASRCGVFAKSDIQPLLNQGATKEDISASIFQAVVSQTIAGLAHGRPIRGNVVYLGGPLTFFSMLRETFDANLKLTGVCPSLSLYYVAYGAALLAGEETFDLEKLADRIPQLTGWQSYDSLRPLFRDRRERVAFETRYGQQLPAFLEPSGDPVRLYVGIDAGSTTTKCAALTEDGAIAFYRYLPSGGQPVRHVRDFLLELYDRWPNCQILGSAATGYGEDIVRAAFGVDLGVVETVAHYTAAKAYDPQVDFIIDIGGQDIKCFKIRNGAVDQIFLNEACSSGCGSFLQSFAGTLGYDMETFCEHALKGTKPVDLGSRCTVFMNSSVKQAQKDGAAMEDIAAGLAVSVVKNALYKVIRLKQGQKLGDHIIVQGGTFLNDAVLRAFELELGMPVTRPAAAGLMGAVGAALYARDKGLDHSTLRTRDQVLNLSHSVKPTVCQGCTNHCRLTVNVFDGGKVCIAGNRCEKPVRHAGSESGHNMLAYKRQRLARFSSRKGSRKTIGIPLVLNMYELLPFWHTLFTRLDFGVEVSGFSSLALYHRGQGQIPSDTVCYPAKLSHGHIQALRDRGIEDIFYPCLSYNIDEDKSVNHYNCPVVAYYPESIQSTMPEQKLLMPYLGIHRRKDFAKHFWKFLREEVDDTVRLRDVQKAVNAAYEALDAYMEDIRSQADIWLQEARSRGREVVVLCGRPYHADPEVIHGIDQYIASTGRLVLSEDSLGHHTSQADTDVLNQWTYHARLYSAARWVASQHDPAIQLVQLVSFGCGVDAITGDEVRAMLESEGCLYTQVKIDEITNLGAVKIRLRSLFAAAGQRQQSRQEGASGCRDRRQPGVSDRRQERQQA